jgi:hypothetical protein
MKLHNQKAKCLAFDYVRHFIITNLRSSCQELCAIGLQVSGLNEVSRQYNRGILQRIL